MKIAAMSVKRTTLNLFPGSASNVTSVFETNNKLRLSLHWRLRLHLQNKQ